ncbi:hypothetical protein F5Y15DRAFT_415042 [Xylariaceae sp. FL0016]|nr:hypothetical protein F5Y15DRAFT_415042 [Xylariaceae sp. FL0016]
MNPVMANLPLAGGPVGGPMPMMNNNVNNVLAAQQVQRSDSNNRANLNTYIYDYFLREGMYDCARAMLNSDQQMNVKKESPGRRDENGNALGNGVGDDPMDTDSKDDIDSKRPSDLPAPNVPSGSDSCFLYEWFCLFWDMLSAQRNKGGSQNRLRQNQQQDMLRSMRQDMYNGNNPMMRNMPNGMQMKSQQQNLARTAMANNQNPNMQMLQAAKQNQMQRDGSNMDGSQNRPSSPSGDNAPSPSKRPRLDGSGPFNPQQPNMMNGQRPQQGMPGQQVGNTRAAVATAMLLTNGIDPANLTPDQLHHFQAGGHQNQAKSIQTYSQNLQQHHGQQMPNKQVPNPGGPQSQGSPMMQPDGSTLGAFYNTPEMAGPGAMRPGAPGGAQGGGSNHALQDYQMQLMLLEQQNKKRLMMARQEQDSMGGSMPRDGAGPQGPQGPGGPPGPNGQPFQDSSPQGARPGASPNPSEQMKRGTPQMNPAGIPSPMPEGAQSRSSPNAMGFVPNGIDPNMPQQFLKMNGMEQNMVAAQMNGGMRPPSSHPNPPFNGQMHPQMMARQQQGPQGNPQMQWAGPNGNAMAQGPQGPQGPIQGTPQQRAMPPPSAPAASGAAVNNANGRNTSSPQTSNAAPPTPQQSNKAAPKKKDTKSAKTKAAAQKKAQPTGATPAAEPTQEETPTPATPITPSNPSNMIKPGQNVGPAANVPASAPPPAPAPVAAPQPDPNMNSFDMNQGGMDFSSMDFANPLTTNDVLQDFDFDSFLHDDGANTGEFDFNPASFGMESSELTTE